MKNGLRGERQRVRRPHENKVSVEAVHAGWKLWRLKTKENEIDRDRYTRTGVSPYVLLLLLLKGDFKIRHHSIMRYVSSLVVIFIDDRSINMTTKDDDYITGE